MCAVGTADRACQVIKSLPSYRAWKIEITENKRKRSDDQNRYLWGGVYPSIIAAGGEQLRGWTAEDLHEFFLGEIYGWEVIEGFGRKRMKPVRRSSKSPPAMRCISLSRERWRTSSPRPRTASV
jgi:hypothetical protein